MRPLRRGLALGAGLLILLSACARRPPAAPAEAEDSVFPGWQPAELGRDEGRDIQRAWQDMLTGKLPSAEKRFRRMLARHPGLVPAQTGLGWAQLRAGRATDAARTFADVLSRRPDYVSALAGAAAAALREGRGEEALALLRRAAALDAQNEIVRRRLGEVRLQITERRVAAARAALDAAVPERAIAEYRAALDAAPEAAEVRLALADVLEKQGDRAGAVAVLEADPGGDEGVLRRTGELLRAMDEHGRALAVYRRILARDPGDEEALRGARLAREALELLQMPEEYRRIAASPSITRADLAALVIVKVTALSSLVAGPSKVAIDISGSWARDYIIRALALDIMDVYPNHTFQPTAVVRRGDLARVVAHVLDLVKHPAGAMANPTDMSANNLFRYPAGRVVGAGLMDLTESGAFEAWRPVSGREAVDVVEGLVRLVP